MIKGCPKGRTPVFIYIYIGGVENHEKGQKTATFSDAVFVGCFRLRIIRFYAGYRPKTDMVFNRFQHFENSV